MEKRSKIVEEDGKFKLYNSKKTRVLGTHDSYEDALRQERAIWASKRASLAKLAEDKKHELIFYKKRSTPEVIEKGEEPKAYDSYGPITKRRMATAEEEKTISTGKWLRVDEEGNKPSSDNYKKTKYRPQLVKKSETLKQAVDNLNKEAGKYDILNPAKAAQGVVKKVNKKDFNWGKYYQHKLKQGKNPSLKELQYNFPKAVEKKASNVNESLTALDKNLSNPTNSQLQQLAKEQKKQIAKENKKPKQVKIAKAAKRLGHILEKEAKAESKSQQRLMGMVHAYQNGELDMTELDPELQAKIKSMAKTMTKKESKDYAETKHKGLPEKKASILSSVSRSAPKLTKSLDEVVQNQRQVFRSKADYAKRQGNMAKFRRYDAKAYKVEKDLQTARSARMNPADKKVRELKSENAKLKEKMKNAPEKKIVEKTKEVEVKKPMNRRTKGLLAAAGVTGMVGAGSVGYNIGRNE